MNKYSLFYINVITCFLLLFCCSYTFAAENNTLELKAEHLYAEADYSGALSIYSEMYKSSKNNVNLLYNIGNIYYRLNDTGKAICFYLKALKYAPKDPEIKFNLNLARERTVDKTASKSQPSFIKKLLLLPSLSLNIFLSIFLLLLTLFSSLVFFISRAKRGELFRNLFIVSTILLTAWSLMLSLKFFQEFSITNGVVISKKAEVKSGPSLTLSTLFFIHEGTVFRIIKKTNGWSKIRLENNFTGWVNDKNFWKI